LINEAQRKRRGGGVPMKMKEKQPGMVVHDCNSSTLEVDAGSLEFRSLTPAWATHLMMEG
jgi:hypothetical protein